MNGRIEVSFEDFKKLVIEFKNTPDYTERKRELIKILNECSIGQLVFSHEEVTQ